MIIFGCVLTLFYANIASVIVRQWLYICVTCCFVAQEDRKQGVKVSPHGDPHSKQLNAVLVLPEPMEHTSAAAAAARCTCLKM